MRDVTKTKPSHHNPPGKQAPAAKPTWPGTHAGAQLATEVKNSPKCPEETKARLIREIIDHEERRGLCTQTLIRKIRKQLHQLT
jgi:hypothetical protein